MQQFFFYKIMSFDKKTKKKFMKFGKHITAVI